MRLLAPTCLCETSAWTRMRALCIAPLAATLLVLSACGDGGGAILTPGGGGNNPPPDCDGATCGEVVIGLTDAEGDFLSYAVDVVSIKLEKANGDTVEALPTRQRVDFADLVNVTEFVTAATIPNGTYVGATVRLDYSDAEVSVEVLGIPTPTSVVDENGDSLGVVDVELQLEDTNHIVVASGTPALLQLDFDLAATHVVNPLTTPVTATLDPVLVATIVPLDSREFRLRGPLVSVDEAAGSYIADIRPFNHPTAKNGQLTVLTTADTAFEVDGDELDQADGLAAMADLGADTPTVAHGVYDVDAHTFTADRVLAGDSVPGATFDGVIGNVTARNGNELTVRGGTVIRTDDSVVFARGDITVDIGPNTVVTKEGDVGAALDIDAISVGQRISALGTATSSDVNPTLDATASRVRLQLTHLTGTVVDTNTGELTLDLFAIDGRNPLFFDFDGTGGSISTDADPQNYQVATGVLDINDFEVDDSARAFGFMTAFDAAPPDFDASTIVHGDDIRALLGIGWGFGGTDAPFSSMGRDGFIVDVANTDLGLRRFLQVGPRIVDIKTLASPIRVEPAVEGRTLYAATRDREVRVFTDFEAYAEHVNNLLTGGSNMRALTARGSFDVDSTTLTANYVSIIFTVN